MGAKPVPAGLGPSASWRQFAISCRQGRGRRAIVRSLVVVAVPRGERNGTGITISCRERDERVLAIRQPSTTDGGPRRLWRWTAAGRWSAFRAMRTTGRTAA